MDYFNGPNESNFEQGLRDITLAPYIAKARALIGIPGKGGANLFRHQLFTLTVLMDYGVTDPIILKAAVIHDLFENAPRSPGSNLEEEVEQIDSDGPEVCNLVNEMTIRIENNVREPKSRYLKRIMVNGSERARILKMADRISNVTFLGFVHDMVFVETYLAETRAEILPHAKSISGDMFRELSDLVNNREIKLGLTDSGTRAGSHKMDEDRDNNPT
jgi:(p)ppGpp synthase/HD superfamily hydrolase